MRNREREKVGWREEAKRKRAATIPKSPLLLPPASPSQRSEQGYFPETGPPSDLSLSITNLPKHKSTHSSELKNTVPNRAGWVSTATDC